MNIELKPGDVVELKSGGPKMTVASIIKNDLEPDNPGIMCAYFDESGKPLTVAIMFNLLNKVSV